MMDKIIPVGSWDFQIEPIALMKVASRGLVGNDRREFLTKRAGDHVFADMLSKIALHPGDIPMHCLAIGATEAWGANRNGDGFNEATCIKQAHTFESKPLKDWTKEAHNGARYYMHHKNKQPPESYGYVKLAAYNRAMRRIELLVIGNGTKEAAERNGGHIMKTASLDKIQRGDDLAWSMACKVAYDVCMNCMNKAATRANYCTSDTCISPQDGFRGLGCRDGLTKLASNGRQMFVENPNALFFDFSEVIRPADRNAYGAIADYMMKAASAGYVPGGAELAEIYASQNGQATGHDVVAYQIKLARDLASIESAIERSPTAHDLATARAFSSTMQPPTDLSPLGQAGTTKMASGLRALAGGRILLSLADFLKLASSVEGEEKLAHYVAEVSRYLPGVYNRLVDDPGLPSQIRSHMFSPAADGLPSLEQRQFATKLAESRSCGSGSVQARVQRSVLRQHNAPASFASSGHQKLAAAGEPREHLARQYALYKLAFLGQIPVQDPELQLTAQMVVLQNYISSQ